LGGHLIPWYRIIGWLRDGDYRLFNDFCAERLITVDDIGSEYATDFSRAKLYELFARRDGKWTLFTANLSLEKISQLLDTRIASRMVRHNAVVVEADVPDFNLR
jgi:DNA replication protein DnaC